MFTLVASAQLLIGIRDARLIRERRGLGLDARPGRG